jgi:hypothetical protein
MSSEMSPLFVTIALGTPIFILVMFLPTLVELKKPKDAGPRLISSGFSPLLPKSSLPVNSLQDIERNQDRDAKLSALFQNTLGFIPNLDD